MGLETRRNQIQQDLRREYSLGESYRNMLLDILPHCSLLCRCNATPWLNLIDSILVVTASALISASVLRNFKIWRHLRVTTLASNNLTNTVKDLRPKGIGKPYFSQPYLTSIFSLLFSNIFQ